MGFDLDLFLLTCHTDTHTHTHTHTHTRGQTDKRRGRTLESHLGGDEGTARGKLLAKEEHLARVERHVLLQAALQPSGKWCS